MFSKFWHSVVILAMTLDALAATLTESTVATPMDVSLQGSSQSAIEAPSALSRFP